MDEEKKRQTAFGTDEEVGQALQDLQDYIAGKTSIDARATQNQEWWRLRHYDISRDREDKETRSVSAWAVNSIMNKHADIMDSFPKPNILPREADDEEEARILTEIVPVILDQVDYEDVYRQAGWDFCIDGGAITGVFWDNSKNDGLGDVAVSNVDVHNLFWKPGIQDIQDSDKVYHVTIVDADAAKLMYPDIADKIGPQETGRITKYVHDDNIDTSHSTEVINMYYKKTVAYPVEGTDMVIPKTLLHLAIFVSDQLAWCSENEPGYEDGFYKHGKYPFVFRRCFPVKDTPWGFGYLDIMKSPQEYIDAMDDDIIKIADMRARPRFWAKKSANIDVEKFLDWSEAVVEVGAGELGDAVRQIDVSDVPAGIMNHRVAKIDELKETSGNRDFNQGGTTSSVTAASAIAALQEAGSKLSRDMNKELYRAAREEFSLVIELIRQFYTEPRSFRVSTEAGMLRFAQYSNAGIVEQDVMLPDGSIRHRKPMFDISISAEKASPFSRAAQNEIIKELYGMGMFAPENSLPAMTCIEAMDFEGKDKLLQRIQENSMVMHQLQAAMQMIQQLSMVDPAIAQMAMSQGLLDPEMMAAAPGQSAGPAPGQGESSRGTPEERAARATSGGDNSLAAQARVRAANMAAPR
jgi:hypothetical protein